MIILGIGGLLGNAASALVRDGAIVAAVEQGKLARTGGDREGMPREAIASCLALAGVTASDVDLVSLARPIAAGSEFARHLQIRSEFPRARVVVVEHHTAHAASAYYPSPFDEATVLTMDRGGDLRCATRWHACGTELALEQESYYPDSLGELYGRVTELLGFRAKGEEHKVQWLSVTGDDRYAGLFREVLNPREGGWPHIDRSFFDAERQHGGGFSPKFFERLGAPLTEALHGHLARGIQAAVEQVAIEMAGDARNLCLAGGLATNALLVSAMERHFENVYVQPASGNAGTAFGAALWAWHNVAHETRRIDMGNLCFGPEYSPEEIKKVVENCKLRFRYLVTNTELIDGAVAELKENRIVAWMHGRMEFGSRALGNRSILASPGDPYSAENLNIYIKHREPFRKFAASVPAELASTYFETAPSTRYLASVGRVRPAYRERFQAAILSGDLVRVHSVSQEDNPLYWRLLHRAGEKLGMPVLYNTSFNLFGEPLVCTPRDAVRSFYSSGIDSMFVGNFFLTK